MIVSLVLVATALAALVAVLQIGKRDPSTVLSAPPPPSVFGTAAPTGTPAPASSCSRAPDDLRAAVVAEYPGASVEDATGDSTAYVLTATPSAATVAAPETTASTNAPTESPAETPAVTVPPAVADAGAGDRVVLLACERGAWKVFATDTPSADLSSKDPERFATHVASWQAARTARLHPRTPVSVDPSQTTTSTAYVAGECKHADNVEYEQCPAKVFLTTTTTTPPTTLPPVTAPDGSVVPTTPKPTSMFCRYNYADPRCKADPSFDGD
jgi:hypothetical protein